MYVCMFMYMYMCLYMYLYLYMYTYVYVYVYACMGICPYIYVDALIETFAETANIVYCLLFAERENKRPFFVYRKHTEGCRFRFLFEANK